MQAAQEPQRGLAHRRARWSFGRGGLELGLERRDLLDQLVHLRGGGFLLGVRRGETEGLRGGGLARGLVLDAQGAVDVVAEVVEELLGGAGGVLVIGAGIAVACAWARLAVQLVEDLQLLHDVGLVLVRETRHEAGEHVVEVGGVGGAGNQGGNLLEVAEPLLEDVSAVGRCDQEWLPDKLKTSEVAGESGLGAVHVVADVSLDKDEHGHAVAASRRVELVAEGLVEDEGM